MDLFITFLTAVLWILFLVATSYFVFKSIRHIDIQHKAVVDIFGIWRYPLKRGLHFVPYLRWVKVTFYPTAIINVDFTALEIKTKPGIYAETVGEQTREEECGAEVVTVKSEMYLRVPDGDDLIKFHLAGIPLDPEELRKFWDGAIEQILRSIVGNMTWKKASQDIKEISDKTDEAFKEEDNSPIYDAGLSKELLTVTVADVKLPQSLVKKLTQVDNQILEMQSSGFHAKKDGLEIGGTFAAALAAARGKKVEEMYIEIAKDPDLAKEITQRTVSLVEKKMAIDSGQFRQIEVNGAQDIEKTIFQVIGAMMPSSGKPVKGESLDEDEAEEGKGKKKDKGRPRTLIEAIERVKSKKFEKEP